MSRLRRPAILAGIVGLFATVVLSGVSAQEAPVDVQQPEPCETVNQATSTSTPDGVSPPDTSALSSLPTVPSTLPTVPVETPTQAQPPETVPQPPCQTTTTTTLPPLDDEDEEYWEEFFEDAGFDAPTYPGSFDVAPYEGPVDVSTGGFDGEVAAVPVPSADTTDAQPIASGEGGFRYALVFLLPLLMLLAAAAVAWTLTQPVTAAVKA